MLTGSVFKTILTFSAYNFWGYLVLFIQSLLEVFFVSKLGIEELAALGIVTSVSLVVSQIGNSFAIAATTFVAKEIKETKNLVTIFVMISFVIGIVFSSLGFYFKDSILHLLGFFSGKIYDLAYENISINFLSLFFLTVSQSAAGVLRGLGFVKVTTVNLTLYGAITYLLTPMLIFGYKTIPAFGFSGVAMSTSFGRFCSAIFILVALFKKDLLIFPWNIKIDFSKMKQFIILAFVTFSSNLIIPVMASVVAKSLVPYGKIPVAAYAIMMRLETFFNLVSNAVFTVFIAFLGQNFVNRQMKRVEESFYYTIIVLFFWFFIPCLGIFIFKKEFLSIFTQDPEVQKYCSFYIQFTLPFLYFEALRFSLGALFNVFNKTHYSFIVIVLKFLAFLLLSKYLERHFGVHGIFLTLSIIHCIFGFLIFFLGRKVILKIKKENI
jgi:Na+-driven multidrug efflux pump